MKVALVGLPQSGKTSLFTALTGTEPSREKAGMTLGIVKVPDARVDKLSAMYQPKKTTHAVIELVGLGDVAGTRVDELSTGTARLVELARALATQPRVLLLDEPAAGLNEAETRALARLLRVLIAEGRAVVLVEHDISLVMEVCDHIYVLDRGSVLAAGTSADIRANDEVVDAYLGASLK